MYGSRRCTIPSSNITLKNSDVKQASEPPLDYSICFLLALKYAPIQIFKYGIAFNSQNASNSGEIKKIV